MKIERTIPEMYEKTRTQQLIEELQQKMSVLTPFAQVIHGCNGDMYQLPAIGSTELNRRTQRMQDIVATELKFGLRNMRPQLFEKFLKWSTDDEKFLASLPINATTMVTQLTNAAERVKDDVLLGTCVDLDESSDTYGEHIIQTPTSIMPDAEDGSPYKGGATGGLLGDNYVGKGGYEKEALPQQPYVRGEGLITTWDELTDDFDIDTKKTNVVPVNYTPEGTLTPSGITIDKLLFAKTCMQARYALNGGGTLCMGITSQQAFEMMRMEKLQNIDYGFQALKTGFVSPLLGIRFLITDSLPLVNVGTASAKKYVRVCPMWRSEDLIYGIWEDAKFHMRQPDTSIDTLLAGVTFGMGAARTREETVLSIHCEEKFSVA
ncbi:phage capsid protein [Akkermansia muciniphila]|uniref:phage capsid protein n=1 Tax=Akkermansia muciniphila TaxID=239935 RepID=UPI0033BD0599